MKTSPTDADVTTTRWVVGVDLSELARLALARALTDAIALGGGRRTEIHAVLALDALQQPTGTESAQVFWEGALLEARTALEPFMASVYDATQAHQDVRCFIHVDIGNPAEAILAVADEIGATQIYVGTHGRSGLHRALMGSVAEAIVRRARCPVLVVRPLELVRTARAPEPLIPGAPVPEPLETHVYRYTSMLETPTAPGHLA